MMQINIGTGINLEDLLESRLLIQANSGGGKSVIARAIMEKAFGLIPFIVFDREGEYYTLKEKHPDVVVIGGSFPDLPISSQSARLLPKEIISNKLSVVIDLSDLKSGEKQAYVKNFLEALMDLPQAYWTGYLIFIEEAHYFCGEQDRSPAGPAVRELMSGGRKRGYCGILITQRISKLHKDAAAECNNKLVGRTNLDIDMDRAAKELGFSNAKDRLKLRGLAPGTFYAYGTSIEPHHVHEVKIALPETKQPKSGHITTFKPGKPTDKMLSALQKLSELPKEAEHEKKTIAGLQAELARLKEQLNAGPTISRDELAQKDKTIRQQHDLIARLTKQLDGIRKILNTEEAVIVDPLPASSPVSAISRTLPPTAAQKPERVKVEGLGKCATAVLQFLASFPDRSWSKAQAGIYAGYSPNSGGFNNALSELNTAGYILRDGGRLRLKGAAADILKGFTPQRYSLNTFKEKLSKCEREIYEVLLASPHDVFSKPALAERTESRYSYTSGGFNNALSTLNTLELIRRDSGTICLNPELMEL